MKIKEIIENAQQTPNAAQIMAEWKNIIVDLTDELKVTHMDLYDKYYDKFYRSVYGDHFSEDLAKKAVSEMQNVDGTSGEHWTIDQTTTAAKQIGILFDTFNWYYCYYLLNMMYSDYYKLFNSSTDTYIKLARSWLMDPDVQEGKAYRYYREVVLKGQ